jgi:hypothetical protein
VSSCIYGTELKNLMERFIQQIKDRTECFDDPTSHAEKKVVIDSICMELVEIICHVHPYGNGQETIYYVPSDGWRLS